MSELWDSSQPIISSRSVLYHLDLIGINTPYVESLTGHITRLAEAHSVYPGVLMEREIAPLVAKQYAGANPHRIYSHTSALNGIGVMASDLVQALNMLTSHSQLHLLTMLPWSEILPQRALLRSDRAWCPICYEEQQTKHIRVYEPLLWTLNIVKICPIHQQPLCNICPHCKRLNHPLSWRSRVGHCSKCGKWLGASHSISLNSNELSAAELEWFIWAANAAGELVTASPSLLDLSENLQPRVGLASSLVALAADSTTE